MGECVCALVQRQQSRKNEHGQRLGTNGLFGQREMHHSSLFSFPAKSHIYQSAPAHFSPLSFPLQARTFVYLCYEFNRPPACQGKMWEREKRVELTISFSPVFLLFPALGNAWGSGGLSSL